MSQPGPAARTGLKCGHCGAHVGPGDLLCPSCGSHLVTALCERCSHHGAREEFRFSRCPVCGHRADIGSNLLGPILMAGALAAFLAFSFRVGR